MTTHNPQCHRSSLHVLHAEGCWDRHVPQPFCDAPSSLWPGAPQGSGSGAGTPAFVGGRCSKGVDLVLDGYPKLVAIDEEPDHEIVHRRRLGKADRATDEPFNPRPQIDVFAFDFLCIGLAHFVLRGVKMALV